jgi:anti-anti-sigma factor
LELLRHAFAPPLDVRVLDLGDMTIVGLEGVLVPETAEKVTVEVDRAIARDSATIVLDCSLLESITVESSEILVDAAKNVREHHGRLLMRQPSDSTLEVLDLTGASEIIELSD